MFDARLRSQRGGAWRGTTRCREWRKDLQEPKRRTSSVSRLGLVLLLFGAASAAAAPLTGTLAKIARTGIIAIGYRDSAPPYTFLDREQRIVGYSIDVCKYVVAAVRATVDKQVTVKYISTEASTRVPLVANGVVDLDCGNAAINQARMREVDFSLPIYLSQSRYVVRPDSAITGLHELIGKRLAVIEGTNADWHFTIMAQNGMNLHILDFESPAEAILSVSTGRTDAFAGDDVALAALMRANPLAAKLKVVGKPFISNAIGLMLRRNDSQFRLLVDATISSLIATGELNRLAAKWMAPLGIKADPVTQRAFELIEIPPE
jgi:glutamate/aspartate transport system substrate-binding protein